MWYIQPETKWRLITLEKTQKVWLPIRNTESYWKPNGQRWIRERLGAGAMKETQRGKKWTHGSSERKGQTQHKVSFLFCTEGPLRQSTLCVAYFTWSRSAFRSPCWLALLMRSGLRCTEYAVGSRTQKREGSCLNREENVIHWCCVGWRWNSIRSDSSVFRYGILYCYCRWMNEWMNRNGEHKYKRYYKHFELGMVSIACSFFAFVLVFLLLLICVVRICNHHHFASAFFWNIFSLLIAIGHIRFVLTLCSLLKFSIASFKQRGIFACNGAGSCR